MQNFSISDILVEHSALLQLRHLGKHVLSIIRDAGSKFGGSQLEKRAYNGNPCTVGRQKFRPPVLFQKCQIDLIQSGSILCRTQYLLSPPLTSAIVTHLLLIDAISFAKYSSGSSSQIPYSILNS